MVSRRRILSRSRDDLHLDNFPEEEDDVWHIKEKLYKASPDRLLSGSASARGRPERRSEREKTEGLARSARNNNTLRQRERGERERSGAVFVFHGRITSGCSR